MVSYTFIARFLSFNLKNLSHLGPLSIHSRSNRITSQSCSQELFARDRHAYSSLLLRPHVFGLDVSRLDTAVELVKSFTKPFSELPHKPTLPKVGGTKLETPIGIAPTAAHCAYHPNGEAETAKGAAEVCESDER